MVVEMMQPRILDASAPANLGTYLILQQMLSPSSELCESRLAPNAHHLRSKFASKCSLRKSTFLRLCHQILRL